MSSSLMRLERQGWFNSNMKIVKLETSQIIASDIWLEWKKNNYLFYLSLLKQCTICQTKKRINIHHINGDKRINELNNLQCLCHNCHRLIHNYVIQVRYKIKKEKIQNTLLTDIKDVLDKKLIKVLDEPILEVLKVIVPIKKSRLRLPPLTDYKYYNNRK